MNDFPVRTPENATFRFELAGVYARSLAGAIDLGVVAVCVYGLASFVDSALSPWLGGFADAFLYASMLPLQFGYAIVLEWLWNGQTLGKRALGLRVVSTRGTRVDGIQAVLRNVARTIDILPAAYLVGATSIVLDASNRRLGDLVAATIVVREKRVRRPSVSTSPGDSRNRFVDDPHVRIAMRRVTASERDAMLRLALRRETLPLRIRHELFLKLATHLEAQLDIARPHHVSPEKFVLNLTALVLAEESR